MSPISVYVGGLGEDIQKEDLEREFSCFGTLTKVWVARRPPGFAFIDFQNNEDANKAIKVMNGAIINSSKIRVDKSHAESKRSRGRSGRSSGFQGGHGGRGGFGGRQDHSFDSSTIIHKGKSFLQGGPRYQDCGDGRSGYRSRSSSSQSSNIAWKPVEVLDCPELFKACEDSSKCESSGKKRKLSDAKNISSGSVKKLNVVESNDTVMNINCLPEEVLIEIFRYLKKSELGCIARVCKWWHKITRYPVLWKKMNVLVQKSESQKKVASSLSENLPACVTHLKLDFQTFFGKYFEMKEPLEFMNFCKRLGKRCPSLKALILHHANFSISLQSAIDLCTQYMQNLEILSIRYCHFTADSFRIEYSNHCKIKVLDLFCNDGFRNYNVLTFSKMSSLKKMILPGFDVLDSWFEGDASFLDNLEVINLQCTLIDSSTFQTLKNHALKLTELYLCGTHLQDSDFRFSNSVFSQLKTLCIRLGRYVTCEALVSVIFSCQFLQNVYVDHRMAASYAQHPSVVANKFKLKIVKSTDACSHFKKDYLYEE